MGSQPHDQTPVWRRGGKEQGTPGAELERPLRHKPAVSGLCPCLATPPHLLWHCHPAPRGPGLLGQLLALSSASLSLPFTPSVTPQGLRIKSQVLWLHSMAFLIFLWNLTAIPTWRSILTQVHPHWSLWFPGQSKFPGACRLRLRWGNSSHPSCAWGLRLGSDLNHDQVFRPDPDAPLVLSTPWGFTHQNLSHPVLDSAYFSPLPDCELL